MCNPSLQENRAGYDINTNVTGMKRLNLYTKFQGAYKFQFKSQ